MRLPYTWPPKIVFFKFSVKVRCCLFITTSSSSASSHVSKFQRPGVPRPRVPTSPRPQVLSSTSPCPQGPASLSPKSHIPVSRPRPTFSHSPIRRHFKGFLHLNSFNIVHRYCFKAKQITPDWCIDWLNIVLWAVLYNVLHWVAKWLIEGHTGLFLLCMVKLNFHHSPLEIMKKEDDDWQMDKQV